MSVALGTIEVRSYLGDRPWLSDLSISGSGDKYPTVGPENRFKNVLFVEKEGFDVLLAAVRISERFDLAIMSTKGMSVIAARMLLDRLAERGVETVYVLHDFDVSGFTIAGTLGTDSRRYRFRNPVQIVDLGLRLVDVEAMALESEPVALKPSEWVKRSETLRRHGATKAEIAFLRSRRVELNAATSPQFIAFLERKLAEHGVTKLIPHSAVLEQHWRRLYAQRRAVAAFAKIKTKCDAEAAAAAAPDDLARRVAEILAGDPALSWDEAVGLIGEAGR